MASEIPLPRSDPGSPPSPVSSSHSNNDDDFPTETPALRRIHHTEGYRAGITAGKSHSATAQRGFDEGYPFGAVVGMRVGWILGALTQLARHAEGVQREEEVRALRARAEEELDVTSLLAGAGLGEGTLFVDEQREGPAEAAERWVRGSEVLRKWMAAIEELGKKAGLDLRYDVDAKNL